MGLIGSHNTIFTFFWERDTFTLYLHCFLRGNYLFFVMPLFCKVSKFFCYFIFFIVLFCLFFETITRFKGRENIAKYEYDKIVRPRLWTVWLNHKNTDPLFPPFQVFANTDFSNPDRLRLIHESTTLPHSTALQSFDFLQNPNLSEATNYTVNTNRFGFRGVDSLPTEKGPQTFRVLCIGSYHTFGHGVENNETYPFLLEKILNESDNKNMNFEVWNLGKQAATTIVGLARLKQTYQKLKPDLVILDFGFVDTSVWSDNLMPAVMYFPKNISSHFLRNSFQIVFQNILQHSYGLAYLLSQFQHRQLDMNIEAFKEILNKTVGFLDEKKIPSLVLRNTKVGPNLPEQIYTDVANNFTTSSFIDVRNAFSTYPPSDEVKSDFSQSKSWMDEFGENEILEYEYFKPHEYHLNIYQYNRFGFSAIARFLSDEILSRHVNIQK